MEVKPEFIEKLEPLLRRHPLDRNWKDSEKIIIIVCRKILMEKSNGLAIFLSAIDCKDPYMLQEVYQLLKIWPIQHPSEYLSLLGSQSQDEIIRMYAVKQLSYFCQEEFCLFIIQLVQCLQFESLVYSPLAEMLLWKSIQFPYTVGHKFFWQLYSQLHNKLTYERFYIYLEQLLLGFGEYREHLLKQVQFNLHFVKINKLIEIIDPQDEAKRNNNAKLMAYEFKKEYINEMTGFTIPVDNRYLAKEFIEEGFETSSKPMCTMVNAILKNHQREGINMKFVFQQGIDILQHQLIFQFIQIFDQLWKINGLDFRIRPYKMITTQDQFGILQQHIESLSLSSIYYMYGGSFGGVKESTIYAYLKEHNPNKKDLNLAINNILKSTAGFFVITYVLGITHRTSDIIFLTKNGHLFHRGLGHIFGMKNYLFIDQEEEYSFLEGKNNLLTKEMVFFLGGTQTKYYVEFEQNCCIAYSIIRKYSNLLVDLLHLQISHQIPELQDENNILYILQKLQNNKTEPDALNQFKKSIRQILLDTSRHIDKWIHMPEE